jgi:hypothetical protein
VEDEEEEEEENLVHRALMDGSLRLALANTPRIAATAATEDASLRSARDVKQEREHAARRQERERIKLWLDEEEARDGDAEEEVALDRDACDEDEEEDACDEDPLPVSTRSRPMLPSSLHARAQRIWMLSSTVEAPAEAEEEEEACDEARADGALSVKPVDVMAMPKP